MFCPKCGKQLPDGVKFCSGCGNVLDTQKTEPKNPQPGKKPAGQKPAWQDVVKQSSEKFRKAASGGSASQGSKGLLGMEDGVCPSCGSHDCEVQLQQDITSSGSNYNCCGGACGAILAGPFGLLCGLCGTGQKTTTTNRSVWLCKKCGNQFPTRKDQVAQFTVNYAALCMLAPICIALMVIFVAFMGPVGFVFAALDLAAVYAMLKTRKKYIGDCSTKDAVANGLLTKEEHKRMVITCLALTALGVAGGVVLFLLVI